MRPTWFAIILPASQIGFSLVVERDERSSTLAWMRQRGLRLLGEHPNQQRARKQIDTWLDGQIYEHQTYNEPKRFRYTRSDGQIRKQQKWSQDQPANISGNRRFQSTR